MPRNTSFAGLVYEPLRRLTSRFKQVSGSEMVLKLVLAYVTAEPEVEAKLQDIPAARDFLDVFAKISGLPPDREVEFTN